MMALLDADEGVWVCAEADRWITHWVLMISVCVCVCQVDLSPALLARLIVECFLEEREASVRE